MSKKAPSSRGLDTSSDLFLVPKKNIIELLDIALCVRGCTGAASAAQRGASAQFHQGRPSQESPAESDLYHTPCAHCGSTSKTAQRHEKKKAANKVLEKSWPTCSPSAVTLTFSRQAQTMKRVSRHSCHFLSEPRVASQLRPTSWARPRRPCEVPYTTSKSRIRLDLLSRDPLTQPPAFDPCATQSTQPNTFHHRKRFGVSFEEWSRVLSWHVATRQSVRRAAAKRTLQLLAPTILQHGRGSRATCA